MAGSMSKAHQRQSGKHKKYYEMQKDVTPVNKAVKMARHAVKFNDKSTLSRLAQLPKLILDKAIAKCKSPRGRERLRLAKSMA